MRKHAAEQLYVALLAADPSEPPFTSETLTETLDLDESLEILSNTAWDGPIAAVRKASAQLRVTLGFT